MPNGPGLGRAALVCALQLRGQLHGSADCFVVCCHARPMRPLVMSWAALHDLERFGYVLGEMHTMMCVIPCDSIAVQNASFVPVC